MQIGETDRDVLNTARPVRMSLGRQLRLFSDAQHVLPVVRHAHEHLYDAIKEFLLESESIYPGIDHWWSSRVIPGLEHDRICQVALMGEKIAALSIARLGNRSGKLCTLRVAKEFRGHGVGQEMLHSSLRALLSSGCRRVHFTISESVVQECGDFFNPYGFSLVHWRKSWYTKGAYELAMSATNKSIQSGILRQMQLFNQNQLVVLSIRPTNAMNMERGLKTVEFRKRFSKSLIGADALFYVTAPVKQVRIRAKIVDVVESTRNDLWQRFGGKAGCSKSDFLDYFGTSKRGCGVILGSIRKLTKELPIGHPTLSAIGFRPPQSYQVFSGGDQRIQAIQNIA